MIKIGLAEITNNMTDWLRENGHQLELAEGFRAVDGRAIYRSTDGFISFYLNRPWEGNGSGWVEFDDSLKSLALLFRLSC